MMYIIAYLFLVHIGGREAVVIAIYHLYTSEGECAI